MHEFILGIDFLTENKCQWDFGALLQILLPDRWVHLRQRDMDTDPVESVCDDCCVPLVHR